MCVCAPQGEQCVCVHFKVNSVCVCTSGEQYVCVCVHLKVNSVCVHFKVNSVCVCVPQGEQCVCVHLQVNSLSA